MSEPTELPHDTQIVVSQHMAGLDMAVRIGDQVSASAGTAFRLHMGEPVKCLDLTEYMADVLELPMMFACDGKK